MEKIQLSFNCRTAGERVIERSTLVNIRVDSVDEAVSLYQELLASMDKGAVISEHKYLPPITTHTMPTKTSPILPSEQELGRCPHCSASLRQFQSRKNGKSYVHCPRFRTTGCSYIKEMES